MNQWNSDYIHINKLKLHYTRTGNGHQPPLILLHGVTDDGLCWTRLAQSLEADYDVIMLDARGHGHSDAPKRGYNAAHQAKDLAGFIAKLNLQHPNILGHSMGAATALAFAGLYPEVPGSILLEDPPPWWMKIKQSAEQTERLKGSIAWMEGLKRKTRADMISEQHAAMPHWPMDEIERWADSKHRFSLNVTEVFRVRPDKDINWKTLIKQTTCPSLLITGDNAYGALVNEQSAAALHTLIPQLQVNNIPAAGHSIRHDQFEKYVKIVKDFLGKIRN
ncbi:MAG: alpha/beta hydrolase [Anaerolineales bacterium]|nr:alpha/beta hydrolase [Anaerolineales bacterium]